PSPPLARSLPCSLPHSVCFFFPAPAPTEIYTLSLHDALPILPLLEAVHDRIGQKDPAHVIAPPEREPVPTRRPRGGRSPMRRDWTESLMTAEKLYQRGRRTGAPQDASC